MKYNVKLTKIGGSSFYALVPSFIRKNLNLNEGDDITVDIKKVNDVNLPKTFLCRLCTHYFTSTDDIPVCPICENENVEEVNGEHGK